MADFDLVVRGGTVATASDIQRCDVGITAGKIVALGASLGPGKREIDARDRLVMPGGVDAHCHLDQPMSDGAQMADDFATGSVSAACGGTTTVIPFACQFKGQSLYDAVEDYHRRAGNKSVVDYAFHLIVSDPRPTVLHEELPDLISKGYTSFKIYMTYDDMKLNDRQILDVLARRGQGRGLKIYAETCPQYLFLSGDDLDQPDHHGMKCICSPPPRGKENQKVIWSGLVNGVFQVFSSDHAPFRFDDPKGKKLHGEAPSFSETPNGIPGLETRMPLLFSEGVLTGKISLQQFVALTATNPAKMYGLYPRKGTIAIGADADLAIWDFRRQVTICNEDLHHNVDYTPYEGMEVTGWPECTLVRGVVVQENGVIKAEKGHGQFLRCDLPVDFGVRRAPTFLDDAG